MDRLILILVFLFIGTAVAGPNYIDSEYSLRAFILLSKANPQPTNNSETEIFWNKLLQDSKDTETRYLAAQELSGIYFREGREAEGEANCQKWPPKPDDFEAQAICLNFASNLTDAMRLDRTEKMFLAARQHFPGTIIPAEVVIRTVPNLIFSHNISRAVSLLKQALETLPIEARDLEFGLKRNIAMIYVLPSNTLEVVKEGVKIYDEAEAYHASTGEWEFVENVAYNKAIAQIFALKDYQQALRELEKVKNDPSLVPDALVFRGFALAKLGRQDEALQALKQVRIDEYPDPDRRAFLSCYMHMAMHAQDPKPSMDNCIHLPKETQSDVILHITQELQQRNLSAAEQLKLLQQFYWFFQHRVEPSIRNTLASTFDGLDVQRARYESQLKDAQLQVQARDSQIKTYALIGSVIMILLFAGGWQRILRQHHKIKALNLYIQKQVLQRFLPPQIIQEILTGRNRLDEHAHTMSVTVLFADLCDFTQQSESLGPERTAAILNTFLIRMTEVIFQYGGTIDKFIGDGIMVIFGAPTELPDRQQAEKAVECAEAMQKALQGLCQEWVSAGFPAFSMRIGIHQGQAVVGSFGGPQRSDYTVIGSTVNIGSRIERMARPGEILISRAIAQYLPPDRVQSTGLHQLRGLEQAQELFIFQ